MNALQLLEQKISSLVEMIKELKAKNIKQQEELDSSYKDCVSLKAENAKLAEENAQLVAKAEALDKEARKGTDQIDELHQEKTLTKMAVDDLLERLKVIDSIVEQ